MGLDITKNKKGQYKLISTISDESYHPDKEWISEDEAKALLINLKFWKFIESAIEIDMTFPNGYQVNGKHYHDKDLPDYNKFMLDTYRDKDCDDIIKQKYEELHLRLKLTFGI